MDEPTRKGNKINKVKALALELVENGQKEVVRAGDVVVGSIEVCC